MVSIKDIAIALSVSPSSVSLVLTGKARERRISEELANRITAKAAEMGYQPNRAAVSLRTGKSKTIGLIVENISNHFFSSLAHTIQEEARGFHYNVVFCSTENDPKKGKEVLQLLLNQQVDGCIITPTIGMEADMLGLVKSGKPLVLMDRCFPGLDAPYVMVDNYKGVQQALNHLIRKKCRRIGYVTVNLDLLHMKEREKAYAETLKSHGIRQQKKYILRLDYSLSKEQAVRRIEGYLQANADLDAVFFATNYLGIDGLLAIRSQGIAVPERLKVICFDDHDAFELCQPAITVVQQPIQEIARTALRLLVAQLGHAPLPRKKQVLIPPVLVARDSA